MSGTLEAARTEFAKWWFANSERVTFAQSQLAWEAWQVARADMAAFVRRAVAEELRRMVTANVLCDFDKAAVCERIAEIEREGA